MDCETVDLADAVPRRTMAGREVEELDAAVFAISDIDGSARIHGYRVRKIELEYSDGTKQLVQLLDAKGVQTIKPATDEADWIKLTVISVYPRYGWEDAGVSELRVYQQATTD